jgi:hypothetical protein
VTPIAWLFITLIVFPIAYLVWALATTDRKAAIAVQTNLTQGFTQEGGLAIQRPPALLDLSRRVTPAGYEAKLDRWLSLAGRPTSLPLDRLIIAKPLLALAGAVLGLLMYANSPSAQVIAVGLFLTALLYFLPDLLIYNKGWRRPRTRTHADIAGHSSRAPTTRGLSGVSRPFVCSRPSELCASGGPGGQVWHWHSQGPPDPSQTSQGEAASTC